MNIITRKKPANYEIDNYSAWYIEAAGTSSETKPTAGVAAGSIFTEVDTGDVYMYNESASTWTKQFSLQG